MTGMKIRDRIHLRDHIVVADIGAFQSEKGRPQRLRFNLCVELADLVVADDQVDQVMSYDILTNAINAALADQRYNLVETLAERIAAKVLINPRAVQIEVSVEKLDRGPGALGVTICRSASSVPGYDTLPAVGVILWGASASLRDEALVIVPDAPGFPLPKSGDDRRIALLALDQAAWALAGELGIGVVESQTEMEHAIRAGQPVIWAPYHLAADLLPIEAAPVALAAWLANRLGAETIEVALPDNIPLPVAPSGCRAKIIRAG